MSGKTQPRMMLSILSILAILAMLGCVPAASASEILKHVPGDCAAALLIRDAKLTSQRINQLASRLKPQGSKEIDPEQILKEFVAPGSWKTDEPVVLILLQPNIDPASVVVGFTSTDPAAASAGPAQIVKMVQGFGARLGPYWFISPREETLAQVIGVAPANSLGASLTDAQRALFRDGDLWLHLRMQPWRRPILQFLSKMMMIVKLGLSMGGSSPEEVELNNAVFDWGWEGFTQVLRQMDYVDIASRLDEEGLRISHLHRFKPDGSVAKYLAQSKQVKEGLWTALPDTPFLLAASMNWQNDGDGALFGAMADKLLKSEALTKKLSQDRRDLWRELVVDWYARGHAMNFVFVPSGRGGLPMEMWASYGTPSAKECMKKFVQMNDVGQEIAGALIFGGFKGKIEKREICGRPGYDLKMEWGKLDPTSRASLKQIYGENPRLQMVELNETRMGYVLASRPDAATSLMRCNDTCDFGKCDSVRRIMDRLPANPHVAVLINPARFLLVGLGVSGDAVPPALYAQLVQSVQGGPDALAGWTLTVKGESVRGDAYMSRRDMIRMARILRSVESTQRSAELATEVARPPRPPRTARVPRVPQPASAPSAPGKQTPQAPPP